MIYENYYNENRDGYVQGTKKLKNALQLRFENRNK